MKVKHHKMMKVLLSRRAKGLGSVIYKQRTTSVMPLNEVFVEYNDIAQTTVQRTGAEKWDGIRISSCCLCVEGVSNLGHADCHKGTGEWRKVNERCVLTVGMVEGRREAQRHPNEWVLSARRRQHSIRSHLNKSICFKVESEPVHSNSSHVGTM
ncbi:hypothetical protein BLNAU_14813 [Blattamonas nauphoetae]|uniref:Uncharacterized protein n=1 Tax=Blattamonas nauphoetae TaxID=2049346 RepID=A0ABQ9XH99_9EUKA|nr:hypothetical protein BLNAU_14813 [Blattamonas nauphoetae]